jgi:hypothetical protein
MGCIPLNRFDSPRRSSFGALAWGASTSSMAGQRQEALNAVFSPRRMATFRILVSAVALLTVACCMTHQNRR